MIDLNADVGEGMGSDDALLGLVTSVNIACGGHAGTRAQMREVIERAGQQRVAIGAHPSYPDREGFGRRPMALSRAALHETIGQQVADLIDEASAAGDTVRYIKPHGALYHEVLHNSEHADALVSVAAHLGLPLLLAPQARDSAVGQIAERHRVALHSEGFADRGYDDAGILLPRTEPGALLTDADVALTQAIDLSRGRVRTASGATLTVNVTSLCVHGDTPGAVALAQSIRTGLEEARVRIGAWSLP